MEPVLKQGVDGFNCLGDDIGGAETDCEPEVGNLMKFSKRH